MDGEDAGYGAPACRDTNMSSYVLIRIFGTKEIQQRRINPDPSKKYPKIQIFTKLNLKYIRIAGVGTAAGGGHHEIVAKEASAAVGHRQDGTNG